ncbi:hypothetical protein CK203_026198 [Vitis vinifera]|uniref:Retrotransposon Copia-like N-terminal domain-containing protein n=1 Tax=Vitis vinifera TaxID=29760 RepID=A0A438ILB0_VITVI|nr:hypothetical protein CK203_026198 [Vitis vinifera]
MAASSSSSSPLLLNTMVHMLTIKLTSSNYFLWKNQFIPLLTSQDLLGFLDGSVLAPSPKKKQFANLAEAFTACSIPDSNDSAWYPDSGATSHLTNDPEGVDVPTVYSGNEQVMVGNGLGHKSSVGGQQM